MADKIIADRNIHDGHRSRMRAKFISHGADIFETYELLEMLLYNVIPFKDTNPIAKRLLKAFGSLDGVLLADTEELMNVDGIGERAADYIRRISLIPDILEIEPLYDKTAFLNYRRTGEFFINYFRGVTEYKITLLLLDNDMLPLSLTDLYDVDCNSGAVTAGPFISEAIKEQASYAIMAHTHPFTSIFPCDGDRATTTIIKDALKSIGINLIEHYIVSGDQYNGIIERTDIYISAGSMIERFLNTKTNIIGAAHKCRETDFGISKITILSREVNYLSRILAPIMRDKSEQTALNLYTKYFSFERAMTAPYESLTALVGDKCAFYIKLLAKIESRRNTDEFKFGYIHIEKDIIDYFRACFIGEPVEKMYAMSFGSDGAALACDVVGVGTVNTAEITPRRILETAIGHKAKSIIIAHNHPRGNSHPSDDDNRFTCRLSGILMQANISLREHYIIADNSCHSIIMRKMF